MYFFITGITFNDCYFHFVLSIYKKLFISYESKKIRNDAIKESLSSNKHKQIIFF